MLKSLGLFSALLALTGLDSTASAPDRLADDAARMAALDPTLPGRKACRGIDANGLALDARLELAAAMPMMSQVSRDMFPLY